MELFQCKVCGNMVVVVNPPRKGDLACCSRKMERMVINTKKEFRENHIPHIEILSDMKFKVCVKNHPMNDVHRIEWILVEFMDGYFLHYFNNYDTCRVELPTHAYKSIKGIYAYCNIHGLWYLEVNHNE